MENLLNYKSQIVNKNLIYELIVKAFKVKMLAKNKKKFEKKNIYLPKKNKKLQ